MVDTSMKYRKKLIVEVVRNGQRVFIEPGDYIIPEPDGVYYYPVKVKVFEAIYELVV
jgi:hypothetical protein